MSLMVDVAHPNTSEKNIEKHSLAVSQTLDFTKQGKQNVFKGHLILFTSKLMAETFKLS